MSAPPPFKNSPTSKSDKIIPIRRVPLSDQSQLPGDYSATPGGTLFSTTPGGTRIIYDRDFLLMCRNSPLTKSPPPNLVALGIANEAINSGGENAAQRAPPATSDQPVLKKLSENAEDSQFQMDI
jgi:hypothetical protein